MAQLKWGILGTGSIAATFAKAVAESITGELVAVASRTQEKADAFGDQHNAPKRYGSYQTMLADDEVQAVYISLPNHMHCEWTCRCAQAGKHILCEKPAATNHAELMVMLEAVRAADVFFMEAFMYRCSPQTQKLVELIKGGAIGEVRHIQASFSYNMGPNYENIRMRNDAAGGGIMDVGCYTVSMARLVAGAAAGQDFADPADLKGHAHIGETSRVDEWATATIKFSGDILATVACGTQVNMDRTTRIFGSKGSIEVPNPWFPCRSAQDQERIIVHRDGESEPEVHTITAPAGLYAHEADVMAQSIEQRQAPSPCMTIEDTLSQQKTLDQWRKQVGLVFDREKPDAEALRTPLHGRPLQVSEQARGRMQYGEIEGVNKPISKIVQGTMMFREDDIPTVCALLDYYVEQGGNTLDTGWVYGGGSCSRAVGHWLKLRDNREDMVIIGKGAHTPHCNPEALTRQLFDTLERLQTDHLDLYFMHRDNLDIPVGEFVDVLNEHKQAGRIRVFGGSNWTIERLEAANAYAKKKGLTPFQMVSNNLSLARWNEPMWGGCLSFGDPESRAWLEETQMASFAWSSQASGFFTGRFTRADTANPFAKEVARVWFNEGNFQRLERAQELARKKGVTPIQIALAWVIHQPFPSYALIGPWKIEELRTSLQALDVDLSADEVRWLALEDEPVAV